MKIVVDAGEAAEQLEEMIDLALRQDDVVICRSDQPIALLTALSDEESGTWLQRSGFLATGPEIRVVPLGNCGGRSDRRSHHSWTDRT